MIINVYFYSSSHTVNSTFAYSTTLNHNVRTITFHHSGLSDFQLPLLYMMSVLSFSCHWFSSGKKKVLGTNSCRNINRFMPFFGHWGAMMWKPRAIQKPQASLDFTYSYCQAWLSHLTPDWRPTRAIRPMQLIQSLTRFHFLECLIMQKQPPLASFLSVRCNVLDFKFYC